MARVALIKLFSGLNLAPAQLAGELRRSGHECKIFYFKDYEVHPIEESHNYEVAEFSGSVHASDGRRVIWNCYTPFNDPEYQLLIDELTDFNPDLIGFSLYSGIIKESAAVTAKLREHFKVPIIWGGAGPTLEPELCMAHADILCINEGEEVIVELADNIASGKPLEDIDGTWIRCTDGTIKKGVNRPNLPLNDIAIPDWRLESYVHINGDTVKHGVYPHNLGDEYPIMTQRGCPFSCSFCIESRYQEMFGKKDSLRRREVDVVLEELRWAKESLSIKSVLFYDDVFTVNPRWLKEFLPRYKEEIGLPFWCYTYPTTHDRALLQKLKDAGCISITMGVQSGSERILKDYYNRPTKIDRVIEAGQEIVDVGLKGFFDLITMNEFDREEDLQATFEFLTKFPKELKCLGFGEMISFPTYSYSQMSEERRQAESDPNNIASSERLPRELYDYYHRLYRLTRTELPTEVILEMAEKKEFRDDPALLDDYIRHEKIGSFTGISF